MPRKKKPKTSLADAYALKNEYEQSLSKKEMKAWDRLVAKAQAKSSGALPLASLPKQEQAAAIYGLMEKGALPLSPVEEQKVLRAFDLQDVDLFGDPVLPRAVPPAQVPPTLAGAVDDPRQLGLFNDPRSFDMGPPEPPPTMGPPAPSGSKVASSFSSKAPLPASLKGKISKSVTSVEKALPGAATKARGLFGRAFGKLGKVGTAGLAIGAVDLLLNPASSFVEGIGDDLNLGGRVDRRLERMVDGQEKVQQFQRLKAKRDRKLAELTQRNTVLLAQNAPHLFNQLMAGRSLPRGATVIGGAPRSDLVEEVAMGMTQGRFPPPTEGDLNLGGV